MPEISIKIGFQDTAGWYLTLDQLELHTPTLLKLWDVPGLLWLYLALLLMPSRYWSGRGELEYRSAEAFCQVLQTPELGQRLEDVATQIYALLRHLQHILLPGMSEDLQCEQAAWNDLNEEYERQMSVLPVSPTAPQEGEILQQLQPTFAASMREAVEESDWVSRLRAHRAITQFQVQLADPDQLMFLLRGLRERRLLHWYDDLEFSISLYELTWERHVQTQ